jgi:hypothetical protein
MVNKDDKEKKSSKLNLVIALLSVSVVVVVLGFLLHMPTQIFDAVFVFTFVILAYIIRDLKTGLARLPFFAIGLLLGFDMNSFLSVDFLQNPSIFYVAEESLLVLFALFVMSWLLRKTGLFDNYRYAFLAVSVVSLVLASSFFVTLVQNYFAVLAQGKAAGVGQMEVDPSIFINIFKSLLLTGLFSFFERLLRIIEEEKKVRTR